MATQTPSVDEYLRLPYQIALARGDDEDAPWTAVVPELPGVEASGQTPEEASARAVDAMTAWIEKAVAEGRSVPAPWTELSGRLLVRMPGTLHAELARVANREHVSLNQFITGALAAAVAWRADGAAAPDDGATPVEAPEQRAPSRLLRLALLADLLLVAVAAAVAVILLATGS